MIDYKLFTRQWLERAERRDGETIDDGDRFISLWVAFNGWLKSKYGESSSDKNLINKAKEEGVLLQAFEAIKDKQECEEALGRLVQYTVVDMRCLDSKRHEKKFKGTPESLLDVLYQIRCNLFHGRKNIDEDEKDKELVSLALRILSPLFKAILRNENF